MIIVMGFKETLFVLPILFSHRWRFAYTCVLEDTVRRRRAMWSWKNIKEHRALCRHYRNIYKTRLLTTKPSNELLADLEVSVSFPLAYLVSVTSHKGLIITFSSQPFLIVHGIKSRHCISLLCFQANS